LPFTITIMGIGGGFVFLGGILWLFTPTLED
jgi:hypothetical protein